MKEQKKEKSILGKIAITISIIIVTVIIIGLITCLTKSMINEIKHKKEIEKYESSAVKYINDKYNENVNATLVSEGYKRNVSGLDGTSFYCGHNRNMKEYIFEIKPQSGNEKSYVTIWKNIETGEITINESYGASRANTSYQLAKLLEEEKKEIEQIVNQSYQNYNITNDLDTSLDGDNNMIMVKIKESYLTELKNECKLMQNLTNYLEGKETKIIVGFNDIFVTLRADSDTKWIKDYFVDIQKVEKIMKNNYNKEYKIYSDKSYGVLYVKINENFLMTYKNNKELYQKIYDEISETCDETSVRLVFKDEEFLIDKKPYKTMEETYKARMKELWKF